MKRTRSERVLQFAEMHVSARLDANKSQEFMSLELGVSKKTVQNWEKGISSPSFFQSLEWFRTLNINPFPYYLAYVYPDSLKGLKGSDSDKKIEQAFNEMIPNISIADKRALLYLYHGNHGSSPHSVLQLILAHLHLPMQSRIANAFLVSQVYTLNKQLNNIVLPDNIQPDMDDLNNAILHAQESIMKDGKGYINID